MGVGIVLMPQVLREKLGEDGAEALVGLLNESKLVQKGDLDVLTERLGNRITEIEAKIDKRIVEVETKVDKRIVEVEAKIDKRIVEVETKIDKRIAEESGKMRSFVLGVNGAAIALITLAVSIIQVWAR